MQPTATTLVFHLPPENVYTKAIAYQLSQLYLLCDTIAKLVDGTALPVCCVPRIARLPCCRCPRR